MTEENIKQKIYAGFDFPSRFEVFSSMQKEGHWSVSIDLRFVSMDRLLIFQKKLAEQNLKLTGIQATNDELEFHVEEAKEEES